MELLYDLMKLEAILGVGIIEVDDQQCQERLPDSLGSSRVGLPGKSSQGTIRVLLLSVRAWQVAHIRRSIR